MARSKGRDAVSLSDLNAGGFLASESRRVETVKEVQNQMLDTFERFNRQQLARGNHEMEFASEFAGEITSARSVPDVMNAYQNWISRRMALYVEDGRKLFENSQRILNTTMKLPSAETGFLTDDYAERRSRPERLFIILFHRRERRPMPLDNPPR